MATPLSPSARVAGPSTRQTRPRLRGVAGWLIAGLFAACSSAGGGGGQAGEIGAEVSKPGGGGSTFFVDPNRSGSANRFEIAEMFWGRLVDVHDLDPVSGEVNRTPVFRDYVINEIIQDDGTNYDLDIDPITQQTRLIILRTKDVPPADPADRTFEELLANAASNLPPVRSYGDDEDTIPNTLDEPSLVVRNAALVIRFNDILDDDGNAESLLPETVRVLTGYPPITPFAARLLFDPNHGAVVGGEFHSTRVIVDLTVSEEEAADADGGIPVNSIGLPPSVVDNSTPNVSIRIPTRTNAASGQFAILQNLRGSNLSPGQDAIDVDEVTLPVLRGMRSGRGNDENNGFLTDLNPPQLIGSWPVGITSCVPDPDGEPLFDFVLSMTFTTPCRSRPEEGDTISIGDQFLQLTSTASAPTGDGIVPDVRVRVLSADGITNPNECLGGGQFLSTYDPGVTVSVACWLTFVPSPGTFPAGDVSPEAQILARFSEPMDPNSVLPFDSYSIIRGSLDSEPTARNTVVGEVRSSPDLREFTFNPQLPLAHQQAEDQYHVELVSNQEGGVSDLAGNPLLNALPFVAFTIDPNVPAVLNGGVVFRFSSPDEVEEVGKNDLRGQFFYDFGTEIIRPRPIAFTSYPVDRGNPLPAAMIPFPQGLQTPLVPLGAKLHTVWRYADLGWLIDDETKYNIDVVGLNWSPASGQVVGDFYEEFEIRLAHGRKLPDEYVNANLLPQHPSSGLNGGSAPYTSNILQDPMSPQTTVHTRSLGYQVNPSRVFANANGTVLVPYPMNEDRSVEDYATFTWRNTAALGVAAPNGTGIPLDQEVNGPPGVDPGPAGGVAGPGNVPTIGLPLLMEFRCYPSNEGIGLNAFDISLGVNSSVRPNFRAFSQGGINTAGVAVQKNPDAENSPSGGFNPNSTPPGQPTPFDADNTFYIGELDVVTRVSRVHTVFVDSNDESPNYIDPVFEPDPSTYPAGTELVTDYRGAIDFTAMGLSQAFDATQLDPYGNPDAGANAVTFHSSGSGWQSDIDALDGARYFQMRFSFFGNIATRLTPELSAVGIAYDVPNE